MVAASGCQFRFLGGLGDGIAQAIRLSERGLQAEGRKLKASSFMTLDTAHQAAQF